MANLKRYRAKRDFSASPEPSGDEPRRRRRGQPRFVVQKHAASSLHYDFRLEVGGALRSWAVPKGPSTDPADRRLAMAVEDHPLSYGDFEGVIGAGYGAGSVIVWDAGTYENLSERDGAPVPIERALADGHAAVWLDGHKLRGAWSLRRFGTEPRERWLLVKRRDEHADPDRDVVVEEPQSVLSGLMIEEMV